MRRRFHALLALFAGFMMFAAVVVAGPVSNAGAEPGSGSSVFINEIHYDNVGADTGEFFEITGPAGTDLTGWSVVLYNGSNGTAYNTSALSGAFTDQADGFGFVSVAVAGIQNGAPDGIALVDNLGTVVQFLSYEGTFTATAGPATGLLSTDIGVAEVSSTDVGSSLQLTGSGTTAGDFTWTGPAGESPAAVNTGQTFTGGPTGPASPVFNEFSVSTTGADVEYIEIAGDAVTDYSEYTAVEIQGTVFGAVTPGQIVNFFPMSSTGVDGLYLSSLASNTVANRPVTLLLVKDFTGTIGDDLDIDDDGIFDTTPWSELADSVSIQFGAGVAYSSTVLDEFFDDGVYSGNSETFAPGGASRLPDRTGDWVRNDFDLNPIQSGTPETGEAENTPGEPNAAVTVVVTPTMQFIHEVQGAGPVPALDGQTVTVQAVVTSLFTDNDALDGFFIQEEDVEADADPATSEGVFVFCRNGAGCPANLVVGDLVTVTGVVVDFFDMTQIDTETGSIVVDGQAALPTATAITLGGGSTVDAATFESTEGMIVQFSDTLVVSEYFELARYGQLVLTAGQRASQFTDTNAPSVAGNDAFLADLATKRIILDDDNNDQNDRTTAPDDNEPYAWPAPGLSTTNFVRGGDSIDGLTGVMHWSFAGQNGTDAWRIRPIDGVDYTFSPGNPRPVTVPDVGGSMTVASFNVLNYFTTLDVPGAVCGPQQVGCRGAHSIAELDRQRAKIVAAMVDLDADVLGLIEIENDDGQSVADLVDALNAATSPDRYAYIDTGSIGTDVIKQALLYQPATVTPVGDFSILDSTVDPTFNDDKNRPVLIQTFEEIATGGMVTIAVNHLKSKGSACDDVNDPNLNDGQANCPGVRTAAATALANFLATDDAVLIIGDLNAYAMEDPITALKAAGYSDLVSDFGGAEAYTYVFDGQVGSLDYAMSNAALTPYVSGAAPWNINADEVPLFDYNDEILDPGESSFERESSALPIFSPDPFRSSDHDPVVVGLNLEAPVATVTISILHNNDGESKLLPGDDFPGIARFVTTLRDLQTNAGTDGVVTLTSGDNFLASKEFNASLDKGVPYYDSIALSGLYDAMALGNHDFDFGPEVTANFISGFDPAIPFLSANADFAGEPLLAALEASGQLAGSTVIDVAGTQVGVIGAITPLLPTISSPRNVVISADVAGAVNAEVAALEAQGVNKIILISHLQGVGEDRALIPLLSGVDIAIAGGGDELFANPGDTCNIGAVADSYPGSVTDADGNIVPLVTGPGGYRCIGQLDATFTDDGTLVSATGSANLVPLDATPDPTVLAEVEDPIADAVAGLEANVLGVSEVDLDGTRPSVRTMSSNEGSLLADALLDAGIRLAADFGTVTPVIGLQNGGGIRNDSVIPAGPITEGDTFDIAPFANFVVVTEVPRETLKDLLEVAYGGLPIDSGRFAQPAGFTARINPGAAAREIDSTCAVIGSTGERVLDVVLDDGTFVVQNGVVVPGPDIPVATIDFLARGGDCYPLGELSFTAVGVSYQQALADYITGTLGGTITALEYPEAGTNRVVSVDNSIPPELNLPADITVEATSELGAVVTFTATATDDVDGDISVTCTPPSGSTFPIGATSVECSATDSSFNTATGAFAVVVTDLPDLAVRDEIRRIADELRDVEDLGRRDATRVARALHSLDQVDRDRYWLDGDTLDSRRGAGALAIVASALRQLERIGNPEVRLLTLDLLDQVRVLASTTVDEAAALGGDSFLVDFFVDRAQDALERGDVKRDRGQISAAGNYYRAAWGWARLALLFGGWW